jgi:tetratricopeptide (TPR) repeat protein/transcriptional regulator with XRE-family HTH domain
METLQPSSGRRSTFGALLRRYRLAAGLTQEELAERAGLSVRNLRALERGAPQRPQRTTIELLAAALTVPSAEQAAFVAAARGSPATCPEPAPAAGTIPPFVGRARELALLDCHLAGEGPPLLLLAGEPGIGKSRLLQAAAARALGYGLRVLAGGCQRQGGQIPYAPLLEALQGHLLELRPAELRSALQGCAWLVRLLPELSVGPIEPLPAWTLPPEQERRLMFAAVKRFLTNVAGSAGTLLVLDDLQWAGPDALNLLGALVRVAGEVPLRVVGAYRDTDVQPQDPLGVLLADLAHAGLAARRLLAPLGAEEATTLLDELCRDTTAVGASLRARMLERTGGVPFFLISCAQELQRRDLDGAGMDAMPWDVAQSVRQRVAALPEGTRDVLGVAALLGRVVRPALLIAATAQSEGTVLAALEAACWARLLEEQGGEAYQFAHDIVREVVEADLGIGRRAVLHLRIAAALERLPGELPVAALAHHYGRSDAEEKALPYLEQAGERAEAQAAYAEAAEYYQELVSRLDALGRTLDGARVRERLGGVLATMANYDAALAVLEQAVETMRAAGDLEHLGRITARMGHIHYKRGTLEEGIARLQPLLERLEAQGPSSALARMYTALAELNLNWGQWVEELAAAERAARVARLAGDERCLARAECLRAWALALMSREEEALPVIEAAIGLAEALGELDCLCDALNCMASIYADRGEFQQCSRYAERALLAAERRGDPVLMASSIMQVGWIAVLCGDWDRARGYYAQAQAIHRRICLDPRSCEVGGLMVALGQLRQREGAWEEAFHYLEEGRIIFTPQGKRSGLRWAQSLLAERDILAGQPEAARTRLLPLLDRWGVEEQMVTICVLPVLAWAHLELGDMDQAVRTVGDAIRRARAGMYQVYLVDALRVQALVAMRQGQWDVAERALEEGLRLAHSIPHPYAEGRLLHVYGAMHVQKADPAPARERLEAALTIFRRLGARKDVERVEQEIGALERLSSA